MRVKIRGIWYDAENEPIVVQLSRSDKENLGDMFEDNEFYLVSPEGTDNSEIIMDIVNQIEEGVIERYGIDNIIPKQVERIFTEDDISQLQNKVHAITGDGDVMKLFNELLGINAG